MLKLLFKDLFFISMFCASVDNSFAGRSKKNDNKKNVKKNEISVRTLLDSTFNENLAIPKKNKKGNITKDKTAKKDKEKGKKKGKIRNSKLRNFDIPSLRLLDKEYSKMQVKRDNRSLLNFTKKDLTSQVIILRKEIILSENDNILEKDGIIAEKLFEDVKNKNMKVYSDSRLEAELNYEDLTKRMIKPVNMESKKRRNEKRKFKYSDIDSILIEEHLFWVKLYPSQILDKMTVTLMIPQNKSGIIEDIIVCYIKYEDFIEFLNRNKIIINNKRMKTTFANAINNNKLLYMLKSISKEDIDYTFNTESYTVNFDECNKILSEIKENHFSPRKI